MSAHSDHENSDRMGSSGSSWTWIISAVAVVLFYLLSVGPVACLVRMGFISTSPTNVKILETVYAPVFAAMDRVKAVEKFYDSWIAICDRMMSGAKR